MLESVNNNGTASDEQGNTDQRIEDVDPFVWRSLHYVARGRTSEYDEVPDKGTGDEHADIRIYIVTVVVESHARTRKCLKQKNDNNELFQIFTIAVTVIHVHDLP